MTRILAVGCLLLALSQKAAGQSTSSFDPFPNGSANAYRFDLARNFYPDEQAAARDVARTMSRARALSRRAQSVESPLNVLRMFRALDSISRTAGKLYAYLSLRTFIDNRDGRPQQLMNELAAALNPVYAEVDRAFGTISEAKFKDFERVLPALHPYAYAVRAARDNNAHRLGPEAEAALSAVEVQATSWGPALFQGSLAATRWGTVAAPEGTLDVRRNASQIRNHADPAVREAGFELGQAALASRADVYAFILGREAAARNAIAQARRWTDYPTEAYAAGSLTPVQVRELLQEVLSHGEVNKAHERARIAEIKNNFGYDTVHVWDLTAPARGRVAPRFTIQDASARVIAAAAPLGRRYVKELSALLDPGNGRLDLVPRPNRADRPGFATGSVGYPSTFFQGRFEGYLDDMIILAHEAGHAVQDVLMDSAGVLPQYATGPNYFTESFATLSQLLLLEHLYRTARDTDVARYFRDRMIDDATDVFRNASESQLELQVYDSVAVGRQLSADQVEAIMQQIGGNVSVWFGPRSERTLAWVQPLQLYTRPLYRVHYVYAKLLALTYLDRLHQNPAKFQQQYGRLLSNGYDDEPGKLLRRIMGIELTDHKALVTSAVRVIEEWARER